MSCLGLNFCNQVTICHATHFFYHKKRSHHVHDATSKRTFLGSLCQQLDLAKQLGKKGLTGRLNRKQFMARTSLSKLKINHEIYECLLSAS